MHARLVHLRDPGVLEPAQDLDLVTEAALELAGTTSASGRQSASQCRTWAAATGNAATVRTCSAVTPGRVTMLKATSRVSSA